MKKYYSYSLLNFIRNKLCHEKKSSRYYINTYTIVQTSLEYISYSLFAKIKKKNVIIL